MPSPNITVMLEAAQKAAQGIIRDFGEVGHLQASRKGVADFVTQTDIKAEGRIHDVLEKARPTYGFLMEEGGELEGASDEFRWVVDPLDGTTNFIHAVPYLCTSIVLEKKRRDGKWAAEAVVIYDPLRDEAFHAEKNGGAFRNNTRLQVSSRQTIDESLLVTHSAKHDRKNFEKSLQMMNKIAKYSRGARVMGATALDLAYIAAGRFDGGWYTAFKHWDIAGGALLVREAKGEVSQLNGDEDVAEPKTLLLGTPRVHQQLLKSLKPIWEQK